MKNENEIAAARNAAQVLSRHKRIVIPRYSNGQFGLLMGKSNKSSHETTCEIMAMTAQLKLELGLFFAYQRFICLDAIDKVKEAGEYRFGLKKQINTFLAELKRVRMLLIDPPSTGFRMFHLGDLPTVARLRFRKDLTDKEYFEFWENQGMVAFNETHKHLYALQWRYEKALKDKGARKAKVLAWLATACSMVEMYNVSYETLLDRFHKMFGYPKSSLRSVYGGFDLNRAREAWYGCIELFEPNADSVLASCLRQHNVELGLQQLSEVLLNCEKQLDFTRMNIEENREVFSSKAAWLEEIDEIVRLKADLIAHGNELIEANRRGIGVDEFFKAKKNEIKK